MYVWMRSIFVNIAAALAFICKQFSRADSKIYSHFVASKIEFWHKSRDFSLVTIVIILGVFFSEER